MDSDLLKENRHTIIEISMNNIIPGTDNIHTLRLDFDPNFCESDDSHDFNKAISEYLFTVLTTIKSTFYLCRIPLYKSLQRMKIESEILDKMGYRNINFQVNSADGGYDTSLVGLFGLDVLVHLSPEYPVIPPIMYLKQHGYNNYEEISISDDIWNDTHTIGQLIRTISKSY